MPVFSTAPPRWIDRFSRVVTVPLPPGSLDAVSVCRHDEARARESSGARLIDPQGADGAARGPDEFRATLYHLDKRTCRVARGGGHRIVVAAAGALAAQRLGGPRRELAPRDVALFSADARLELQAAQDEAWAIVLDYVAPPRRGPLAPAVRPGVARISSMAPLRARAAQRLLPAEFHALISPRDLYTAVGPIARGPGRFEVVGPSRLVVVVASTPPQTGPALHIHRETIEMFVVLAGRFRVTWGDAGERGATLERFDAIVVPPGVSRAFTAIGAEPGWIMPVVVGADDETRDLAWLPEVHQRLREAAGSTRTGALLYELLRRVLLRVARRPEG